MRKNHKRKQQKHFSTIFQYNGPDDPFPMKQFGKKIRSSKNAVQKTPLGSRTFPGFTIPKKRTQFFVYFA